VLPDSGDGAVNLFIALAGTHHRFQVIALPREQASVDRAIGGKPRAGAGAAEGLGAAGDVKVAPACARCLWQSGTVFNFSTDLDFTDTEDHNHEDIILAMMEAFARPFHGIQFAIPDEGYYETEDTLSSGVNPIYSHDCNQGDAGEVKLQISRRETPTLPTVNGSRILLDLTFKRSGSMILPQLSQREMSKFLPQYVGQLIRLRKNTGEALAVNLA
jgi:hypothetical protein